jgi:outer membrane biogenesis lipoprotein LolB
MKRLTLLLVVLAACPRPQQLPSGPMPEAQSLYEQALKAHALPDHLLANVKAGVSAPQNGGRYSLHLAAKKPDSIRVEALNPVGDPALILVASRGTFMMLNLRDNLFQQGPATPRNLSRFLPTPLRAEELVALVLGAIPELPDGQPTDVRREGDGYLLTLQSPQDQELLTLGPDLRVWKAQRKAWSATLDKYSDESGQPLPLAIHIDIPSAQTSVDLSLRNADTTAPVSPGAFVLAAPQGARVEEVR